MSKKKGLYATLQGQRYTLVVAVVLIVLVVSSVLVQLFSSKSSIVSHEELQSYFLSYLTEYEHLVEENMGFLDAGVIENDINSGAHTT